MHALTLTPSAACASVTEIRLGSGTVEGIASFAGANCRVLLVADARLQSGDLFRKVVSIVGERHDVTKTCIVAGEPAKSVATLAMLWDRWIAAGADRDSVVVALGGGSVIDVAGFAAACFLRGIPWIVVPTTVLAMADAAIGGKTGVNLAAGKNLAGAIHHPRAVLADLDALETLDEAGHADGWAEVVKAGVIGDIALFEACERRATEIRRRDRGATEELLVAAIRVKAAVVEADAQENSRREILNFGHTAGHALERVMRDLSHGRAVAAGMVAEARLAVDRGRLPEGIPARIEEICRALGLALHPIGDLPEAAFLRALGVDKKRRAGRLRVALPARLGAHSDAPSVEVEEAELLAAIRALAT